MAYLCEFSVCNLSASAPKAYRHCDIAVPQAATWNATTQRDTDITHIICVCVVIESCAM